MMHTVLRYCPNCEKEYEPELLPPVKGDNRLIQDIYPDALPYQREQLQTGICSDKCWDEHLWGDGWTSVTVYDENGKWISGGWRAEQDA